MHEDKDTQRPHGHEGNPMNGQGANLVQRRAWFRYFPEGTLEFLLVTRVLALLLLAGLTVVRGSQRPGVLLVLGAVILVDYLLILWWGIQLVIDLRDLASPEAIESRQARKQRLRTFLVAMLPAVFVLFLLTPVLEFLIADPVFRNRLAGILNPAMAVVYLILLVFACRRLLAIQLGNLIWVILLLVPGLHLIAMQRLVIQWQHRISRQLQSARVKTEPPARIALHVSDIAGVATLAAVGLLVIMNVSDASGWDRFFAPAHLGTTAVAALFAIAQVALMENVQRRYLAALRVESAP